MVFVPSLWKYLINTIAGSRYRELSNKIYYFILPFYVSFTMCFRSTIRIHINKYHNPYKPVKKLNYRAYIVHCESFVSGFAQKLSYSASIKGIPYLRGQNVEYSLQTLTRSKSKKRWLVGWPWRASEFTSMGKFLQTSHYNTFSKVNDIVERANQTL